MGWVRDRYYVRTIRREGRVLSVYIGEGDAGRAAAAEDERRRAEQAAAKAQRERLLAWSSTLDDFCIAVERLVQAALEAAGYHRHDRGGWRKRRGSNNEDQSAEGTGDA